jgi:hypothetical protein
MQAEIADFGNWYVEYLPGDGARISVLKYRNRNLLTAAPEIFRAPGTFTGEFETRPVYGYDDCFPTVDPCIYPAGGYKCRDHGELCWLPWTTAVMDNILFCSAVCLKPHVIFRRVMTFGTNSLLWRFETVNMMAEKCVFLHVMHALLPPSGIRNIELPRFGRLFDEGRSEYIQSDKKGDLTRDLINMKHGGFSMLLLKDLETGKVKLDFTDGYSLEIGFDHHMFPTLGIWWNNYGYPGTGQPRQECAFEPIPGSCSDLAKSFRDGICLSADPGETLGWEVRWEAEF